MAVNAIELDGASGYANANILESPRPDMDMYPLLANGETPTTLATLLRERFAARADVEVAAEVDAVQMTYEARSWAVDFSTDVDVAAGHMPPAYQRRQTLRVRIGRDGIEEVEQRDKNNPDGQGLALPTTTIRYSPARAADGATLIDNGNGWYYMQLGGTEQTMQLAGVPAGQPAEVTENTTYASSLPGGTPAEQTQTFSQLTQDALAIVNGLFPIGRAGDGLALVAKARELEAARTPGLMVGQPDADGRVAVIASFAIGGALYSYKCIVDAAGRTLYYYHSGSTLMADPAAKAQEEAEQPGGSLFTYDDQGRVSMRWTRGQEISAETGQPIEVDDVSRLTYSEIPLRGGGVYEASNLHREIHADGQVYPVDFDFQADMLEAVKLDPNRVHAIQFQHVKEARDPSLVGKAKQAGEVFTRVFTRGNKPTEQLVLTLRVVERDGTLLCELVDGMATLEPVPEA